MNLEYFDQYPKRNLTVTCYHDKDDKNYQCLKAYFQCLCCSELLWKKGCDHHVNLCALCCIDYSDALKGNVCPDEEVPERCHENSWHANSDVSICKVDRQMKKSSDHSQDAVPVLTSDFSQVKRAETRVSSVPFPSHPSLHLHPFPSRPYTTSSMDSSGDSDSSSDIEVIPAAKKPRTFIASPLQASPTKLLEGEVLATPEESIPSNVSPLTHDPFVSDHSMDLGGDHSTDLGGTMDNELFQLPYILNIDDDDEDAQATLLEK